jgi:GNAT superfamily N-acetyltransferase
MFSTRLLTPATWPDFEALFVRHGGLHGGCWCTYHRMTMSAYISSSKEERRALSERLVLSGEATGLLLYDGETVVGWCQFGKAEGFPAFDRMRDYVRLEIPATLRPVWRITCFVVDRDRRREGLSRRLLEETLKAISGLGGGIVEVFPLELPGSVRPQYTGSVKMYLEHGFTDVAGIGKHNRLLRRYIES